MAFNFSIDIISAGYSFANQKDSSAIEAIEKKFVHKISEINVAISQIVKLFSNNGENFYTCQLLPQFNKSPFFDHCNDHCSMVHLIECCRQFAIALPHKYHAIPFVGYYNLIKRLDVRLLQFFEHDSNIIIFCKEKPIKYSPLQKSFELEFEILQGQITKAMISGDSYILHESLYNKMRNK